MALATPMWLSISRPRSRDPACSAKLYLRPFFNGAAGEDAALAAILAGDLPVIEIVNELDGSVLDRGHPSAKWQPV